MKLMHLRYAGTCAACSSVDADVSVTWRKHLVEPMLAPQSVGSVARAAGPMSSPSTTLQMQTELHTRDIQGLGDEVRADIAQLEVRLRAALESLRDDVHAERRAMSRVVNLAVAVAFISLVFSIAGLG